MAPTGACGSARGAADGGRSCAAGRPACGVGRHRSRAPRGELGRVCGTAGRAHWHSAAQLAGALPGAEAAWLGAQTKTLRASEQDRADVCAARTAWQAAAGGLAPERLIFVDESGCDTRLGRTHARAPRGQRAYGTAPGGWTRLTLLGALGLSGLCAAMTIAAATSTAVFLAFVTEVLIPALQRTRPDAIVVMDNLAPHKAACVRHALDQAGISYRYLPAYSPDMNPIEPAWSKLKTYLRTRAARSRDALEAAIPDALQTITPSDAQGWFRHAGYTLN